MWLCLFKLNYLLEKWVVKATEYKEFYNITIPNKCKVNWKLKDGNFNWLNLEITGVRHNINEVYL